MDYLPKLVTSSRLVVYGKSLIKNKLQTINQSGASLVELIMVFAVVGFLILLLGNLPSSIGLIGKSRYQGIAREIVAKQIEDKRIVQYDNLANGTENISDSRLTILPEAQGTIITEDCSQTVCTQDENAKEITVSLSWKDGSDMKTISLKTLIAQGGLNQ